MRYAVLERVKNLAMAMTALVAGVVWIGAPTAARAQVTYSCTEVGVISGSGNCATDISTSTSEELVFNTPSVTTVQTTSFQTELIGKISGGTPLYDQTFALPFSDPLVQAGVVQARLAITTAGGPGVVILGPTLTSQTVTNSSASVTTYSFNHAVVTSIPTVTVGNTLLEYMVGGQLVPTGGLNPTPNGVAVYANGQVIGTYQDGTAIETEVNGVVQGPKPDIFVDARSSCTAGLATLPSTTKPSCSSGGTPVVIGAGLTLVNADTDTTDFIDQSTVTTDNTLTSSIYTLTGTVESFGTVRAAVADQGFDAADRFGRRLLDAGPNGGTDGSTPGDPMWLEGYGFLTRTGASGAFPGDHADGGGINGGLDYDFPGGLKLGVAADYDSASIGEGSVGEQANLALTQVGIYGGWRSGSVFAALEGTYGWGSASTSVSPIGLGMTASSRFDPSAAGVSGEVGDRLSVHGVALTPSVGAAWSHVNSGAFSETGSALDLTGPSRGYDRYQGWLGLDAETILTAGGGALTLRAYGRALALGGDDVVSLPVTFVGGTTMLAIDGANTGAVGGDLGASADYRIGHNVRVFAAYDARLRERYVSQTGSAGVKISF